MPDSITLLIIAAAGVMAWYAIGASRDAARQRRRADRLAARCADMRQEIEDLHHIIWPTEPTQPWNNVRVLKDTDK